MNRGLQVYESQTFKNKTAELSPELGKENITTALRSRKLSRRFWAGRRNLGWLSWGSSALGDGRQGWAGCMWGMGSTCYWTQWGFMGLPMPCPSALCVPISTTHRASLGTMLDAEVTANET